MGCCSKKTENEQPSDSSNIFECPKCKNIGAKVKIVTPQTFLKDCCKSKLDEELTYKFCKNTECEVAYFSSNENNFFNKDELKIKATLKDKGLDIHVCYCFNYTRQNVLDELKETGKSTVVEDIKAKMKDPGCFCETSNPQGGCCLANNIAWVKEAMETVKKS